LIAGRAASVLRAFRGSRIFPALIPWSLPAMCRSWN